MSLIARLEKRFGRYAAPNVTIVLIVGQVSCYLAEMFSKAGGQFGVLDSIQLVPQLVVNGEVWRVLTYVFDPPRTNPLFAFFYWYLFYLMGTTLEATWSTFRYNLFLLIGFLASIAFTFGQYLASGAPNIVATNVFLYTTVFLAFARLYPDFTLHLFLILPVKIKWLALLTWITYLYMFVVGGFTTKLMIVAAVLNYLLFFGRDIWRDMKQGHRRMQHQGRVVRKPQKMVHECRICGLTSTDSPRTAFRYCSQCEGQCCYCPEHLQSHQHVVKEPA